MYFKYDPCLSPTFVYGALLRLKQVDWLDRFNTILASSHELMWELRKSLPGFQGPIEDGWRWSYSLPDDTEDWKHPWLVVVHSRAARNNMMVACEFLDEERGDFIIEHQDLWYVATPTAKYA
jgi:hypothetical protein